MSSSKRYDVVVIGAGITGLSALRRLAALGVGRVAVARGDSEKSASRLAAGLVTGGQVDNFTRVSHAHGEDFGAELWRFGDQSFDALAAYCVEAAVGLRRGHRLRLISSEPELVEARKATAGLRAHGFDGVELKSSAQSSAAEALTDRILAVQDDGERAGVVDVAGLMSALERDVRADAVAAVRELRTEGDHLRLTLADGQSLRCEMAICAAHLAIGNLVPELKSALVSVADQWVEARADAVALASWQTPGTVFSVNHTYEWGAVTGIGELVLGGGRYLRPWAGIEAEVAPVEDKITKHLLGQLEKTFRFGKSATAGRIAHGFLDCRPCDELPIIGPMYGNGRLLVATGYMGAGLTMGFEAGRCLAELVANGTAVGLPRRLWPERLRSLES